MSGWQLPPQPGVPTGPPPPWQAPQRRAGSVGYWVGGLILVLGIGGGVVMATSGFTSLFQLPTRLGPEGSAEITAEAGQDWAVYTVGVPLDLDVDCLADGPATVEADPRLPLGTLTINDVVYTPAASFTTPAAGTYTVRCTGGQNLAVGPSIGFAGSLARAIGGIFLAVGSLVVGVVVIVVTVVRRSRRPQPLPYPYPPHLTR